MKKVWLFAFFLFIGIGIAVSEEINIVGSWKVENQYENRLGDLFTDSDKLSAFLGDEETKPLVSLDFKDNGIALITLLGGAKVNAFYQLDEFGYYLQPQGGKDTTLFLKPIAGGMLLAALNWRYPSNAYFRLLLILSKQ